MTGWEVAAPVLLGIVVIAIIVFSVIRPSSAIRFGVFIERKILDRKEGDQVETLPPPPSDEDTKEIKDAW